MTVEADAPMSTEDRLIYMANQIARNFATMGHAAAAAAVADHILSFWDPRMKARIDAMLADQRGQFSPIAAAAIEQLRVCAASQTPATEFNAVDQDGHCDAG